jgi:ATP-dependent RNA helicase DDX52/ROK1
MEDLFNILSSATRIDKSKRRKGKTNGTATSITTKNAFAPDNATRRRPPEDENGNEEEKNEEEEENDERRRPKKREKVLHTAEKLAQVRREEMAAFRRRMGIRISADNRHEINSCSPSAGAVGHTIPDAISSFGTWKCPSWWDVHVDEDDDDGGGGGIGRIITKSKNDERVATEETKKTKKTSKTSSGREDFHRIRRAILANVERGRWTEPTPIQMQAVPCLSERRDVMGCAPTGSGKTGAFVLPAIILAKCDEMAYHRRILRKQPRDTSTTDDGNEMDEHDRRGQIRTVLLAPSRELASQLCREVQRLSNGMPGKFHCVVLSRSNAGLATSNRLGGKCGLDCLVSTPLRLVECMERGMKLSGIRLIVLDEADRLLDASDGIGGGRGGGERRKRMTKNDSEDDDTDGDDEDGRGEDEDEDEDDGGGGSDENSARLQRQSGSSHSRTFLQQIDSILSVVPPSATRALFSATLGPSVRHLSESILRNPVDITTGIHAGTGGNSAAGGASEHIRQELKFVGREEGKLLAIRQLVTAGITPPVLIFLQSKERAQALFGELLYDGMRVDVIHAGRSHADRELSVQKFRRGDTWILICTDLVARGVDFKAVNLVINYDLPADGVSYVHRIGRTGRAGREGRAITLFTEADFDNLRTIANVMRLSGCEVPEWMITMKKKQTRNKSAPPRRGGIDTTPRYDKKSKRKKGKKHANRDD